jgi:23S rRNA (cytidine1920-2'-O)/16S rRNA (cytidine1409-2'-O)-methyltransferase
MRQTRLDTTVVAAGLAPTRSRARDLIQRGFVTVDGVVCVKPGQATAEMATVVVSDAAPVFVSRGAEKLSAALDQFRIPVEGRIALDVGASTGGFTQVLLQRGVAKVFAIDVGRGQLHASLRDHPKVIALEQTDARSLTRTMVPDAVDLVVADVSFISLTKALGAALSLTEPGAGLVALIKPQFEVGREHVGSGGIVRDESARQRALDDVRAWIAQLPGWSVVGLTQSPILGGSGNTEYLIGARRDG